MDKVPLSYNGLHVFVFSEIFGHQNASSKKRKNKVFLHNEKKIKWTKLCALRDELEFDAEKLIQAIDMLLTHKHNHKLCACPLN